MALDVVGLGALNMDNLYRVDRILDDGETVVEEAASSPGGSAANTVYGLARLELRAGFVGAVGDDADGQALVRDFQMAGVDTSGIVAKTGARTGSVLCLSDRQGKRSLYVTPGANNLLTRDDIDLDFLNTARIVHMSSFVHDKQFQVCREVATALTTRLSFSPGSLYAARGADALEPLLKKSHVLFINGTELCRLTGNFIVRGAESCLKMGTKIVVVTLGQGMPVGSRIAVAYIRDGEGEYVVEPLPRRDTTMVDATGAGDAFAAGFLFGLLDSRSTEQCGRLGHIAAQFCITRTGARPGLPTREQMEDRYRELYGS